MLNILKSKPFNKKVLPKLEVKTQSQTKENPDKTSKKYDFYDDSLIGKFKSKLLVAIQMVSLV